MSQDVHNAAALVAPAVTRLGSALDLTPGLYTMTGERAKGTKRPLGVATKIRELNNPAWFAGTALYKLDPVIRFFHGLVLTEAEYVIICNIPATAGNPKVSLAFAANGHGNLFNDETDVRLVEVGPRLVGSNNHRRLLSALQGGYEVDLSKERPRPKRDRSRKLLGSVGHG